MVKLQLKMAGRFSGRFRFELTVIVLVVFVSLGFPVSRIFQVSIQTVSVQTVSIQTVSIRTVSIREIIAMPRRDGLV